MQWTMSSFSGLPYQDKGSHWVAADDPWSLLPFHVLGCSFRGERAENTIYHLACCCWLESVLLLCGGNAGSIFRYWYLFCRATTVIPGGFQQVSFTERLTAIASVPSHFQMAGCAQDLQNGPTNLWPPLPCPLGISSSASNVQKTFPFSLDRCNPSLSSLFHL